MTSTLQLKYSKKQLLYSLGFGLLWILIFVFYYVFRSESYFGYGYLAIGVVFLANYLYKKLFHYASIENGVLIKNDLFRKQIKLNEITDLHYFSGKYKLLSRQSEMTLNTMLLEKKSLEDLKKVIKQINNKKP